MKIRHPYIPIVLSLIASSPATSALAVASFTIGMGVNSTWAGNVPAGGKCTQDSDCGSGYICQGVNEKECTKK